MASTEGVGLRMGGLTEGRIVHWRNGGIPGGRCEAAIVVVAHTVGTADLRLFGPEGEDVTVMDTTFAPAGAVYTFHEPGSCPFAMQVR